MELPSPTTVLWVRFRSFVCHQRLHTDSFTFISSSKASSYDLPRAFRNPSSPYLPIPGGGGPRYPDCMSSATGAGLRGGGGGGGRVCRARKKKDRRRGVHTIRACNIRDAEMDVRCATSTPLIWTQRPDHPGPNPESQQRRSRRAASLAPLRQRHAAHCSFGTRLHPDQTCWVTSEAALLHQGPALRERSCSARRHCRQHTKPKVRREHLTEGHSAALIGFKQRASSPSPTAFGEAFCKCLHTHSTTYIPLVATEVSFPLHHRMCVGGLFHLPRLHTHSLHVARRSGASTTHTSHQHAPWHRRTQHTCTRPQTHPTLEARCCSSDGNHALERSTPPQSIQQSTPSFFSPRSTADTPSGPDHDNPASGTEPRLPHVIAGLHARTHPHTHGRISST